MQRAKQNKPLATLELDGQSFLENEQGDLREYAVAWHYGQGARRVSSGSGEGCLQSCMNIFASVPIWQPCSDVLPNASVAIQPVGAPTSARLL